MALENKGIIDIHTHIFNLNYLPIRGVIESYKIPSVIAIGVEFILLSRTKSSDLNEYNKSFLHLEDDADDFSLQIDSLTKDEIAEDIAARINEDIFYAPEVQNALVAFEKQQEYKSLEIKPYALQLKSVEENKQELFDFIFLKIKALLRGYKAIRDYLKWFRFMMRSEKSIYKNLIKDYGHIKTMVFHMMDPEYFFTGKPTFTIEEKIDKMQYFLNKTDLKMIGFVPYNPKRDNHLEIVSNAIKNKGFSGVKFYPPMGYRPALNTKDYTPSIPNVKNATLMDDRITEFFQYVVKNDIPVFTHCTPDGFEAVPGSSGKNCNPIFWEALLSQAEFSDLRLCLGHAGGAKGWFTGNEKKFNESYAKGVYDLCTNFKNVYCEVGFLADVKDNRMMPNFRKRLQNLFKNDNGKYEFKKKIMFGSDWHILFNHGINKKYDKAFEKLFRADVLKDYVDDFFFTKC